MKDIKLPWVNAGERLPVDLKLVQVRRVDNKEPVLIFDTIHTDEIIIRAIDINFNSTSTLNLFMSHQIEWLDDSPEAINAMIKEFNTRNGGGERQGR